MAYKTFLGIPGFGDLIRELAGRFPDTALAHPTGVLCRGGDLSLPTLLAAYSRGIFPWFDENSPILWWSPDPRCVILPEEYHLPRRSRRTLRQKNFAITLDQAFEQVITSCGRRAQTWITPDIVESFLVLHATGFAHSVEAWLDDRLVGGLYGLALGRAFFGESMFHTESEASRACLAALIALMKERGMTLLDCQQETPHIMAQGGRLLPRQDFEQRLARALAAPEQEQQGTPKAQDAQDTQDTQDAEKSVHYRARPQDLPGAGGTASRAHDSAGWQDAAERSEARTAGRVPNILACEYADLPGQRKSLWPFLPWRTSYVFREGSWKPVNGV
ncbi:MAG TPA: leucyl/phenylalanyl-tRNA--protein transferase [Candidatus Desulfovibrio intestinipullorum]|uniref:Leucyl/phenylalanyl-tRNA--protein transferase n=1 Tax=Candidatus Desulfovibrio intestinipullorum TaxID=2838536 RepID=A0A9D1PVF2_9BACT|nr:leucyl/phenylalanyl-tRNA--protein transferase [Candidatus Desulfovibrio intestinipullorum]